MRRTFLVAAAALATVLVVGVSPLFRREPAEQPQEKPLPTAAETPNWDHNRRQFGLLVQPGQMARSKPDANGLVTMIRPAVTHLAVGDPVQIAIHWAKSSGPIERYEPIGDGDHEHAVHRVRTLNSMRISVTSSDGTRTVLQPSISPTDEKGYSHGFYYEPTYILTLTTDGISDHVGYDFENGQRRYHKGPWQEPPRSLFDMAGVYEIRVSGMIIRKDAKAIPFETPATRIQIGLSELIDQQELERIAINEIRLREPDRQIVESNPAVIDDVAGNRRARVTSYAAAEFGYIEHWITLSPNGAMLSVDKQTIDTCVARGTMISTLAGVRPIEDLRVGELVWGYDISNHVKVRTPVRFVRRGVASSIIAFHDTLLVTPTHPVLAGSTWKMASEVSGDDQLLSYDLTRCAAGLAENRTEITDVYDIAVDSPHNFFAGGFLVHNKSRGYSPDIDDLWYILWPEDDPAIAARRRAAAP